MTEMVEIDKSDFDEVIRTLRTSKRYIELTPDNAGENGAAGQIEELIQRLRNSSEKKPL